MGVCCGLPGQEAAVFRLLEGRPSRSHALVLTRGLNLPSLGQKAAQQHTSSTGGFWSASPTAPRYRGLRTQRGEDSAGPGPCEPGGSGQEREGLRQRAAKCLFISSTNQQRTASFRDPITCLKLGACLKAFLDQGHYWPLVYTLGKKTCQIGYNASKEQTAS